MNRPRRLLTLFAAPLVLLGAAAGVRSRLPRPQTVDDQWLWQLGESSKILKVQGDDPLVGEKRTFDTGFPGGRELHIRNRGDIRAILRAFHVTQAVPSATFDNDSYTRMVVSLSTDGHLVSVDQHRSGRYEVEFDADKTLVINAQSVSRLMSAIRTAAAHARAPHARPGEYSFARIIDGGN